MRQRSRCLVVWVLLTVVAASVGRWSWAGVAPVLDRSGGRAPLTAPVDDLVTALAGLALVGCAAWAWAVGSVVVVDALRVAGRVAGAGAAGLGDAPRRGVPAWAARAVLAACGVAALTATPAHADPVAAPPQQHLAAHARDAAPDPGTPDGLPYPDRATGPAATPPSGGTGSGAAAAGSVTAAPATVVVRPGDSLWRIAAGLRGPDAPDADVAAVVVRLHALNRAEIGPDPDLIQPGQRLRLPDVP